MKFGTLQVFPRQGLLQEHGHRRALGEVVDLALVHGIHADYAAELVRRFALRPPASRPGARCPCRGPAWSSARWAATT